MALMLLSVGAWAQYAGTGVAKRAGTHIKVDGEKLSQEDQMILLSDIGGRDFNPAWQQAKAGRNAGMGLTIGGEEGVQQGAQLSLGPTGNGFGITLSF